MRSNERADGADPGQVFIEQFLRTGFALIDTMSSLIEDLPEDAFPGEDNAAVVLEMVTGSCRPAFEAVGEAECRTATALIGAVHQRVIDDLRRAVELAKLRQ